MPENLPTSPALAEVAHFVTTLLPSTCRVTLKGRAGPRLSSAGQGPPPLTASSPAKGEKQFFGGYQTEPPAAALITAPPNNSVSAPRGRPLAGLDPARLSVVVADQAIDAGASFATNEART